MAQELPRIGAEVAGYRLESLISRGGMAVVYLAEDIRLGRKVALKLLAVELAEDDSFRERFLRESRIAASIDHPNVVPIHDAGEAEGVLYIAMRHVEDTDLRGLLRAEGPLELDRAVAIAVQIAGALEAAHRRDLVHRDVKPANVLVLPRRSREATDHVYLSDFGLAKSTSSISGLTASGQFVGTVNYTAPEQVEGKPVDGRTDIYALGCVLFECLTGQPPFKRDEELATVMAHLHDQPPAVTELRADCPPALAAVVARMLAKAPEDRYQTCDELIGALRRATPGHVGDEIAATRTAAPAPGADGPVAPDDDGPPAQPSRPGGRARWIAAGVVTLAAVAAVLLLVSGGDDEDGADPAGGAAPETQVGEAPKTDPGWRPLSDSPSPHQQAASAVSDGRIWILGGLTGETTATVATDEVEAYDPAIDGWTAGPRLPAPLHHAMAVDYQGELVVIGGWTPKGSDLTAVTSSKVFALRDGKWIQLPELDHPRAAGAAAVVGDRIVVVGGQADGELVRETEVFDGEGWSEGAEIPTPREHLAAASDGRFVYAVGGRALSADKNSAALERFDPVADEWAKLPSMPDATGSLGAAIVGRNLVAVGGEDPTSVLETVQAFDLDTEEWSTLPPMLTPRHGMAVVAVGDTVYALDGALAPAHSESTSRSEALDFG
jgi:hypothetical protein